MLDIYDFGNNKSLNDGYCLILLTTVCVYILKLRFRISLIKADSAYLYNTSFRIT